MCSTHREQVRAGTYEATLNCETCQFVDGRIRAFPDLSDSVFAQMTAHHEAGHAVAAALTGHDVIEARVTLNDIGGYVHWKAGSASVQGQFVRIHAGLAGYRRWLNQSGHSTSADDVDALLLARLDLLEAHTLAHQHGCSPLLGAAESEDVVAHHWTAIQTVARLLQITTLTGEQIQQIITPSSP